VTAKPDDSLTRLKRAAATAISAAAVKAKLLAEQEEDQIRRLAALVVEKLVRRKIYSIDCRCLNDDPSSVWRR
jgi:SWI/SNF related-matrix-associated actin-dependent regulator of chromatin subfamily C